MHGNATYRSIVGHNMLRAFGYRVALCCDTMGVSGSSLKMVKFEPTTLNTSQHGGQTQATCCAQQCCDMLRCHVAIVWPGLNSPPFITPEAFHYFRKHLCLFYLRNTTGCPSSPLQYREAKTH